MRVTKHIIMALLLALLASVLPACSPKADGESSETAEAASTEPAEEEVLIPIEARKPERSDVYSYFETTSRVIAERRVDVVAEGVGQCLSVNAEEGDHVKEGDILAELDTEELRAQIKQTQVNIAQQRSAYERAKKALDDKVGGISVGTAIEVENTKFALEQAQATLSLQEVQLAKMTIRAPIGGTVTKRGIQKGMMVTSGVPAFSIVDPNSFVLPIYIPERQLASLQVGQTARVKLDTRGEELFDASVTRINPSVDPTSGTVKVMLEFGEKAEPYLREAAFARVKLVMEEHTNVLVVPKDSVVEENTRNYLMVVEKAPAAEGKSQAGDKPRLVAKRVEIQTGLEDSQNVEVVSGITPDTLVVTLGQHTLKADSLVVITNTSQELARNEDMTVEEGIKIWDEREARQKERNLEVPGQSTQASQEKSLRAASSRAN